MPTTRHGSDALDRGDQRKQEKAATGPLAKSYKPALTNKTPDASSLRESESVRSTRRSHLAPESSLSLPKKVRGTKTESTQQAVIVHEKKIKEDEIKPDSTKLEDTMPTRSSKRIVSNQKVVPGKKQKHVSNTPTKPVGATKGKTGDMKVKAIKVEESIRKETPNEIDKPGVDKSAQPIYQSGEEDVKEIAKDEFGKKKAEKRQRSSDGGGTQVSIAAVDFLSPRRSSRAVVPNSRFKDMVDPGKKKSIIHTKKDLNGPAAKRKKVDYTAIHVQHQGNVNEITEEIITEEIKIDSLAQMNIMEDMIILQSDDVGIPESQANGPETSNLNPSQQLVGNKECLEEIQYQPGHADIQNEISSECLEETHDEVVEDMPGEVNAVDSDIGASNQAKGHGFIPSDDTPEANVIIIPSESGKHLNRIVIPKDPYRARLEQAFEKKGSSMVIGPSIGKAETKKIIVTPTHKHVSKKEVQRSKYGIPAEATSDNMLSKKIAKPSVTSVIYPRLREMRENTTPVIHTPGRSVKCTVLPKNEGRLTASGLKANLPCDEDKESVAQSGESSGNGSSEPNVKIVYVKAKQKNMPNLNSNANRFTIRNTEDRTMTKGFQTLMKMNNEGGSSSEHFEEIDSDIGGNSAAGSHLAVLDGSVKDDSVIQTEETSKALSLDEEFEEVKSVPVEQNIASSLCQVIEFKQQPQTAIEYVLVNDKMVPIHKPYQAGSHHGKHGRQNQAVNRPTPGRVETGSHRENSNVKRIPASTAQSVLSTVISQGGDKTTPSVSTPDQPIKFNISTTHLDSTETVSSEELKTTSQAARVVHGYIDLPGGSSSPTKIVEISTEAFNKEIYGDEIALPTVTGQIVSSAGSEIGQIKSVPAQSVSTDVSTVDQSTGSGYQTEFQTDSNQSEVETGYHDFNSEISQSVEESCNQSVNDTPTMIVKTEHGTDVTYAMNEGEQLEEMTNWTMEAPTVSSDPGESAGSYTEMVQDGLSDNIVHIEGIDRSKIPENAVITVEKLASGGEIVIMQIKDTDVSETLEKLKPGQPGTPESPVSPGSHVKVVSAKVVEKPGLHLSNKSHVMSPPVRKMSDVKITPVKAYTKTETQSTTVGTSCVSKTTGTNTEITEDTGNTDEEEEDGIPVGDLNLKNENPFQEYIVVRLPEGAEVKRQFVKAKRQMNPTGEQITMNEEGLYVCVDCGHKTDNRGNWFKHRRKHLGIRPHACTKCSYRAATSSNLKRHMMIHDDVRNFQCAYCETLFRQKIHLERHLKYKHEEKNVQCPLCDYVCSSENPDLKVHIKRRHMPNEGALNAFTCDVCGLMTVSKKDLKQHKKFHKNGPELKLFCEHCSFVTDCVSRLRRHMLIHTKERPFQCGLCAYRATQKEHVLRHMRSQHGVEVERNQRRSLLEKNYSNPQDILIAGTDQSASSTTRNETSEIDLGPFEKSDYSSTDKIFACNYCSMKFSKLINLYKHLYAQHKDVMPDEGPNDFQCVVCDFRTTNKKNLLVHMRKHNMQDHSPPTHVYSCVLCRYINPRRRNLFQHMKKKHGIEIIMKDDGLNCYVTLENAAAQVQGQNVKSSVMALSDIVTTQTVDDATQNLFISESGDENTVFHAEKISIDNIIADEMESYVVTDSVPEHTVVSPQVSVSTIPHSLLHEHEAAEAIEGLQALAEQAGILETQNIDNDMTTEIVSSAIEISPVEVMNDGGEEVLIMGEDVATSEAGQPEQAGQVANGLELSSEQLNQLATGDYVEINGEVYKVEIAPEHT